MNTSNVQEHAKKHARPWIENLARCGYAAKGLVYGIIGILALQSALGAGGQTTDTKGALFMVAQQSWGRSLLVVLGIGLFGYALWRIVMGIWDSEAKGNDFKGIAMRIGYGLSGLAYGGLALTAFQLVAGAQSQQSGHTMRYDWTARALAQPLGRFLIVAVGLIVIGIALSALYTAYSAKFREHLKSGSMSATEMTWVTRAGRAGYSARGIVFLLIGWFFIRAALQSDAKETGGLDQALTTLAHQPYGPWLLGVVALGLIAYGLYGWCEAFYRRVDA